MKPIRHLLFKNQVLTVTVMGLALAGSIAIVRAVIPDSSGLIHGCYQNNNGSLRVVDTGRS